MQRAAALVCLLSLGACATAPTGTPSGTAYSPRAVRAPAPAEMLVAASTPPSAGAAEAARRLYTVADTVMIRGAALCEGRIKPSIGLRAWNREVTPRGRQAAPTARDPAVTVFAIANDGPAARAGLAPRDQIVAINGARMPETRDAMAAYAEALDSALESGGPIAFAYRREGRDAVAQIIPAPACDYRVVFANSPVINAATDGHSLMVMRGLVNLLARDEELALVVGHELSHNVLGHFARGRAMGLRSPFGGPRAAGLASLRDFEREADYVGVYFVALAGYDYANAIESSRRMAAIGPLDYRGSATHPSQAERYQVLAAAVREIRAKLAQGTLLRPNLATG
ncbi:MAG: M48 family metalloprotease, partial [Alphaproteobacteria bacterium]